MPYSFLIVYGFFNVTCDILNMEGTVRQGFIVLIREDLKVFPFANVITTVALISQLF